MFRMYTTLIVAQLALTLTLFSPTILFNPTYFNQHYSLYLIIPIILFLPAIYFIESTHKGLNASLTQKIRFPSQILLTVSFCSYILSNLITLGLIIKHGDYQILYLENSLKHYITPLKALGLPAFYFAFAKVCGETRFFQERLAWAVLLSSAITGSRGLLIFAIISALIIRKGVSVFLKPKVVLLGIFMILCFLLVGYFREPITIDFDDYILLTIGSIAEFSTSNLNINACGIDSNIIVTEAVPLFFGVLDESRSTYLLTSCISPEAIENGYGIAVSALGESVLALGSKWYLLYYAYLIISSLLAALLITRKSSLLRVTGMAFIPFFLYSVRAELVYPYVFLIRIFFATLMLYFIDAILPNKAR